MKNKPIRIFCIRKGWWQTAVIAAMALAMFALVAKPPFVETAASQRQLPIYCVDRGEQKLCSISFDAAWGNEDTQTLIDILDRYQVKATFFVVGQWAEKYPESVKALHDAGHEVMNHSSTHPHFPQMSPDEVIKELNGCNDKVEAVIGVRPTLVRFPYGDYDDASINAARSIGMEPIQWDVEHLETEESHCSARV